ncbi:uncharacterized protein LOC108626730 [Ceratina calcarata]|uniref:Uncharacterized protein LOC108626730 n=1 Tax=Ceratina calcarata TaxID=156304 RepID=A0AAJ7J284_9HYME|nr:uncharacterized protein LOC108626730 [Ceratina calcarata]
MHIKLLFILNAVLTFAIDVSWAGNQQSYGKSKQLSLNHGHDTIARRNDKQPRAQKTRGDKSVMDKREKVHREETLDPWNLSADADRIQFQIEGHKGPQTYIFGFDTGYGKNRQYRLEERHRNGTIKGQYGYYDAMGKLRRVKYIASPLEGYTEIHHESNVQRIEK